MTDQPQEAVRSAGGGATKAPHLAIARVAAKQARGDYDMVPVTFLVDGEEVDGAVWFGGGTKGCTPRSGWNDLVCYRLARAAREAMLERGKSGPFSLDPTNSDLVLKAFGV